MLLLQGAQQWLLEPPAPEFILLVYPFLNGSPWLGTLCIGLEHARLPDAEYVSSSIHGDTWAVPRRDMDEGL